MSTNKIAKTFALLLQNLNTEDFENLPESFPFVQLIWEAVQIAASCGTFGNLPFHNAQRFAMAQQIKSSIDVRWTKAEIDGDPIGFTRREGKSEAAKMNLANIQKQDSSPNLQLLHNYVPTLDSLSEAARTITIAYEQCQQSHIVLDKERKLYKELSKEKESPERDEKMLASMSREIEADGKLAVAKSIIEEYKRFPVILVRDLLTVLCLHSTNWNDYLAFVPIPSKVVAGNEYKKIASFKAAMATIAERYTDETSPLGQAYALLLADIRGVKPQSIDLHAVYESMLPGAWQAADSYREDFRPKEKKDETK